LRPFERLSIKTSICEEALRLAQIAAAAAVVAAAAVAVAAGAKLVTTSMASIKLMRLFLQVTMTTPTKPKQKQ